jgi:hypothetical protein
MILYWSPSNPNWWGWHRFLYWEFTKRGMDF